MHILNSTERPRSDAKQTVAVIDDDYRMLESLHDLLDAAGFDVRLFASPDSFLGTSAVHEVDCVISDIGLPTIDGFALQRLIRQARAALPVILITGRHDLVVTRSDGILLESLSMEKGSHRVGVAPFGEWQMNEPNLSSRGIARENRWPPLHPFVLPAAALLGRDRLKAVTLQNGGSGGSIALVKRPGETIAWQEWRLDKGGLIIIAVIRSGAERPSGAGRIQ
jgi:CheY-like chemotaxis protein